MDKALKEKYSIHTVWGDKLRNSEEMEKNKRGGL
jgi:hypothetical protein